MKQGSSKTISTVSPSTNSATKMAARLKGEGLISSHAFVQKSAGHFCEVRNPTPQTAHPGQLTNAQRLGYSIDKLPVEFKTPIPAWPYFSRMTTDPQPPLSNGTALCAMAASIRLTTSGRVSVDAPSISIQRTCLPDPFNNFRGSGNSFP